MELIWSQDPKFGGTLPLGCSVAYLRNIYQQFTPEQREKAVKEREEALKYRTEFHGAFVPPEPPPIITPELLAQEAFGAYRNGGGIVLASVRHDAVSGIDELNKLGFVKLAEFRSRYNQKGPANMALYGWGSTVVKP